MATLNWKTPGGTTGSLNLANVVLTNTTQTISGAKTFSGVITSSNVKPLRVTTTYNDGSGTTYTSDAITVNTSNTAYGNNIALGGGGNVIVGGGESYSAQLNDLAGNSSENAYLVADENVYVKSNCNTFANAKTFTFKNNGTFVSPGNIYVGSTAVSLSNHTHSNMTAATASAAGKAGLVPAPAAGKQTSFLRGDGTWVVPTNTTYSTFVKSGSSAAAGLVPKPSTTAGTTKYLREDCTWQVPPDTNTTYSAGTAALLTTGTDTTNRVWTAKILSDFVESKCTPGSSIAANGYVKLDSGLIIQWGISSTGWTPTVTFPIAFTTSCYAAVCSTIRPNKGYEGHNHVWNVTKTGMTLIIDTGDDDTYRGYWIAIGK